MRLTGWIRKGTMTLAGAALLLAGAPAPAAAQTYTLKIGNATLNDVQHEWQKRWGARVEKRAGGRIKVEIYPASQIGSIPRMIEGLQLGTLEAWIGSPEFGIFYRVQDERVVVELIGRKKGGVLLIEGKELEL